MKPSQWNPSIKYLVKNLEMLRDNSPINMNKLPLCHVVGQYNWLWKFQEYGWTKIRRSTKDGRVHLVHITITGLEMLAVLKKIADADDLHCYDCDAPIERFFRVPNAEWIGVMGDERNKVICRPCYEKRKEGKK